MSAGDVDYERLGHGYSHRRRADPRIAAQVHAALGSARTVLNVGAGAGSYEPQERRVVAVEPSAVMRAQRPQELAPAINAVAELLPFDDGAFDAAMATVTVHQWSNALQGLRELRRVTRGPVVVLTFDRNALDRFWLARYAPEMIEAERRRYPEIPFIADAIGSRSEVQTVPIPHDCADGFTEAFYARPELLTDPEVRRGQSAWNFVTAESQARTEQCLRDDLASGVWDERYGSLRTQPTFEGSLRLVVGQRA